VNEAARRKRSAESLMLVAREVLREDHKVRIEG
jgi:hypothetical protein